MDKFQLDTHYSFWFIGLCLLAGLGYAYFLYQANTPWSKRLNNVLFGLRFVVVTAIAFLLLEPFLNHVINEFESPVVVIGIDNSRSVTLGNPEDSLRIKNTALQLEAEFKAKGFEVELRSLNGPMDSIGSIRYDNDRTNLGTIINQVETEYEGVNFNKFILVSDGIYNQGVSPEFVSATFPIHVLGVGDTIPKKDVHLRTLFYNKISYQGSEFPIVAELAHHGYDNKNVTVVLSKGNKEVERKEVKLKPFPSFSEVKFKSVSEKEGMKHYVVSVIKSNDEFTTANNVQHAYIDVINSRQKILLYAASPHPDIKAIKSVIDKKEKYELIVNILSTNKEVQSPEDASLVIFHQLPNSLKLGSNLVTQYANKKIPMLFYVGNRSDLRTFNEVNNCVSIKQQLGQVDEVNGVLNSQFSKFSSDVDQFEVFKNAPPIQVPFGEYGLKGPTEVVLYQQIGSILTDKPLVVFRDDNNNTKTACVIGEDTWRWRLFEFLETEDTKAFDTFFQKLFQLLSSKDDKRKLRVRPVLEAFEEGEPPSFTIETYNDIYEKVFDQKVAVKVINERGDGEVFSFVTTDGRTSYSAKVLPEGVYSYEAKATVGGKEHIVKGAFVVTKQVVESNDLVANHHVLRSLARKNKGTFISLGGDEKLSTIVGKSHGQQLIHSSEREIDIVDFIWVLFVLVLLVSTEWFIRKANGGY